MDIPAHILDAVSTSAPDPSSPKRVKSTSTRRSRRSPISTRFPKPYTATTFADDRSSTSDSELDHDYQTDFTTPAHSETTPDDMQPDDVEDFRDREYPQLKGKVYLDHGGTTVGRSWVWEMRYEGADTSVALREVAGGRLFGRSHSKSLRQSSLGIITFSTCGTPSRRSPGACSTILQRRPGTLRSRVCGERNCCDQDGH